MSLRILIAPDKFKGSLTAAEAAQAISEGLLAACPEMVCECLPVADGGEGTAESICKAMKGEWLTTMVSDPLGRLVPVHLASLPDDTAVLDMSSASGLGLLSAAERNPLHTSTRGTGQLLRFAIENGAKRLFVGLGGSATNDGGLGMARSLGYEFLDNRGEPIAEGMTGITSLSSIRRPAQDPLRGGRIQITGLCDVRNPLCGPRGASAVFGPQKGAKPEDLRFLDAGLQHLARVVARDLGCDVSELPGAGAAGGLGFGLMVFCGAKLQPGFPTLAQLLGMEARIAACNLVITGEGSLDLQTLEGKAPAGVAGMARQAGKPVVAFAGVVEPTAMLSHAFDKIIATKPADMPLDKAMKEAAALLRAAASRSAGEILALARSQG